MLELWNRTISALVIEVCLAREMGGRLGTWDHRIMGSWDRDSEEWVVLERDCGTRVRARDVFDFYHHRLEELCKCAKVLMSATVLGAKVW